MTEIRRSPSLSNEALNRLFSEAWPRHDTRDFRPVLDRSLAWLAAFDDDVLVGFLNVAWDGGAHGFILDVTVAPAFRRRGIALSLLREARAVAEESNLEWLHVDFEPELTHLYRAAGFEPTEAGLVRVADGAGS